MNYYHIRPYLTGKDETDIQTMICRAIQKLYPQMDFRPVMSMPSVHFRGCLFQESGSRYLWVRIFDEPLTHAILDQLKHREIPEVNQILKKYFACEFTMAAFIFFPSLIKGVLESLHRFPREWHFFEYYYLESYEQSGLAIREHFQNNGGEKKKSKLPSFYCPPKSTRHQPDFKRTCLSREELSELIEISMALKTV